MLVLSMCIVCVPIISDEVSAYETDDWLEGWSYRKAHIINQSASVTDGYVFGLKVYNGTGTDGTETVNGVAMGKVYINTTFGDFREVRITESDGTTILPYWIQNTTFGVSCVLWFRSYDDFSSSSNYYYIYYGNENAFSMSSGELVFDMFDDFENGNIWTRHGATIPTPSAEWTYAEPTLMVENNAQLLDVDEDVIIFKLWWRAFNINTGDTSIRYAESLDCFNWEYNPSPVVDTSEGLWCPFILKYNNIYYMYVHGNPAHSGWNYLDRWISNDGISWTKDADDVLSVGSSGQWDDYGLGNNFVMVEDGTWYMFYDGTPDSATWYMGLATSPDGKVWTKYASNPILGNVSFMAGSAFVKKIDDVYHMWFHGGYFGGLPTDGFKAYSMDLENWYIKNNGQITFPRLNEYEGNNTEEGQVADFHIQEFENQLYMVYEGVNDQETWHEGICLATTGLTFEMLSNSTEDSFYNITDNWYGGTENITISNGIATHTGTTGGLYSIVYWNGYVSGNTALSFYGKYATIGTTSNVMVFGFVDNSTADFNQLQAGSTEVHRVQVTSFTTTSYNIDQSNHYYEIRRYATGSRLNVDGNLQTEITTQIFNNVSKISMINMESSLVFDDIFVRPYYVSEPTHYTWEEFETYDSETPGPEPEPSNPSDYLKVGKVLIVLAGAIPFIGFIIWALGKQD